ncbi:MAG TPA: xanthine dehydrogenase family protein molybdopterin-binding subunit [Tepidisphaeraceae bacterium]|jgi:xanthine dehydrogenase YagR molybdenum-binding subunit
MATTQPIKKKKIKVPQVVNGVPTEVEIEVDDVAGPTWGANDKHRLLNTRIPRSDGPAKTTGTAIYTFDVRLPDMQYGRFVVSKHARANIKSIDTSAAEKIPGVTAVVPFAKSVRYEGEPIVAIAAKTREAANDAVRAVVVEYEPQPFVVVAEDSMKPGAPQIFPPSNRRQVQGNADEVAAAFKDCDAVIDVEYRTKIMHHACLETHGVVVDYRGGDTATVYASTQGTFTVPGDASKAMGLKQSDVTCIVQHMGGGFGSKFGMGIAGLWGCKLSKQLGVPVKMMLTRRDEFLTGGNGPGSIQKMKAGATKDGTLVACHSIIHGLAGVGRANIAGQPYQYKATTFFREQTPVNTNEDASVAMRAPGFPQASFAIESLMDELAEKIGMDPVQFRIKNVTNESHKRQLLRGAEAIGWANRPAKAGSTPGHLKRGFGCGIGAWGGGGGPKCIVNLVIGRDGTVTAESGSQDLGTGTRTYVRAIVAEELGLGMNDVLEKIGSSKFGDANASGGSTTAASLAPAVKDAAFNARVALAKLVAPLLGAQPDAVTFENGKVLGNGKSLDWKQACMTVPAAGLSVQGQWQPGLSGNGAHGASFAEVEVDVETGHIRVVKMCHVQDGGLILNRLATESQINGGMIQSLGMALFEERVMDRRLGVMLNPNFGEYKLPGCLEMPELIPIIDDGDTREAVIGIAEPANIPGVGAVANAVYNACGVRVRDLPITPDKILNGLYPAKA